MALLTSFLDYVFDDMWRSKGHPEIVFLDLRPVNWGMSIIASNEVAEQITRTSKMYPISVTKSPTMGALLPLIGKRSIFVAEVCAAIKKTLTSSCGFRTLQRIFSI